MAKVAGIDPNRPEGKRDPKLGDDDIRKLAAATIETLSVDHYMGADGGAGKGYEEDDAGKHNLVTFREAQGSKPTLGGSDVGAAYVKQVSANGELHYEDETGNEVRITKAKIAGSSFIDLDQGRFDNNSWIKAINAAGNGTVNIAKVNTGDGIEIADGAILAAATEAGDPARTIADKGYVDTVPASLTIPSPVEIYNQQVGTINTWEDLDFSGTVGTNSALVFIEVKSATSGTHVYLKPKGSDPTAVQARKTYGSPPIDCYIEGAGDFVYTTILTDSSGKCSIACQSTTPTIVVNLLGYVKTGS